ncbi:hypothetical protein VOLCADRAFT_103821 [Volvox carteri f. nagariensis]|uniref:Centrosomal protein of 19 kDa n=1 Tax=Volvox carteri f. nagariensis TaxID=3068 RepID=D8TPE7_VOLCA|nr:uncharacterized protein VOLCADRAFT_103821 [Volvox carteri f. nagariensis]EFJ50604.1 hypothetical protein VOLCADRAFT_103821 [Volvox carteri f. nagariensis]|eukprot:XP_002948197.1 hypothetical protein VOLCADRAFT_103821 [Volvox carteri f. nagariensis]
MRLVGKGGLQLVFSHVVIYGQGAIVELMPSTVPKQTVNPAENGSSRKEATMEKEASYKAKRYALKYQPPCIFLEYEDTTKNRRVRAHGSIQVKLNGVQADVDVDRLTRKVRRLVVALVDFLNNESNGVNGANPSTPATAGVANGLGPARNGTTSHVPSRLGPGGGGSNGGGTVATGSKALSRAHTDLNHRSGASNGGAAGVAAPLPSMSPRGLDPRNGPAARLAMLGLEDNCRGSVESTMSRFSTSTASPSSSGGGSSGRCSGNDVEEEDEGEEVDAVGRGGDRGGGGGANRLDFALDELEKEMAGMGDSGSDFSSMVVHGGPSGTGSLGVSSELGSDSRTSSVVSGLRDTKPLPPLPPLTTTAATTTGSTVTAPPPPPPGSRTGASLDASAASAMAVAAGSGGGGGKTRFAAEAEKLVIGLELTDELDLNKVTEVELRLAKQAMESDFKKNQLKPGDPGYVYDKQEDFGPPTEINDWDDSEDDEEAEASEEPEVDWEDIHASVSKPKGAFSSLKANAGLSSEEDTTSRNAHSPYNSNDWPSALASTSSPNTQTPALLSAIFHTLHNPDPAHQPVCLSVYPPVPSGRTEGTALQCRQFQSQRLHDPDRPHRQEVSPVLLLLRFSHPRLLAFNSSKSNEPPGRSKA